MILLTLSIVALVLSLIPFLMVMRNLQLYRQPDGDESIARISILIPARNEEANIEACIRAALASSVSEVIVLDDGSTDRTIEIVRRIAEGAPQVRLAAAPPMPAGWCGKQHACFELSKLATGDWLVFIDADVRLAPGAASRAVGFAMESDASLVSGFPRQVTETWLEQWLIPLIHFVLLGFLPIGRMRASNSPAFGAGCGQFFVAKRSAYEIVGGHTAIKASLHDGVTLPRAFRAKGFKTDLFDATNSATCRMYHSTREVWQGLSKNATEGMASVAAIVPWTIILGGGQVLPIVLLVRGLTMSTRFRVAIVAINMVAIGVAYAMRLRLAQRFAQSLFGVVCHPVAIVLLLAIQWTALIRKLAGASATWKGRAYGA